MATGTRMAVSPLASVAAALVTTRSSTSAAASPSDSRRTLTTRIERLSPATSGNVVSRTRAPPPPLTPVSSCATALPPAVLRAPVLPLRIGQRPDLGPSGARLLDVARGGLEGRHELAARRRRLVEAKRRQGIDALGAQHLARPRGVDHDELAGRRDRERVTGAAQAKRQLGLGEPAHLLPHAARAIDDEDHLVEPLARDPGGPPAGDGPSEASTAARAPRVSWPPAAGTPGAAAARGRSARRRAGTSSRPTPRRGDADDEGGARRPAAPRAGGRRARLG